MPIVDDTWHTECLICHRRYYHEQSIRREYGSYCPHCGEPNERAGETYAMRDGPIPPAHR